LIAEKMGIKDLREIDEKVNRLPGSGQSYTFHGRDVYAYTAARLASGKISFAQVGKLLTPKIVAINYQKPVLEKEVIKGTITILDVQYGNLWTNIDAPLLKKAGINISDSVMVKIYQKDTLKYTGAMPFANTFSAVPEGKPISYLNSLLNFSVALNMGNFAEQYHIKSGPDWKIVICQANKDRFTN
jgi:S-adenosylmethionine hydrolase